MEVDFCLYDCFFRVEFVLTSSCSLRLEFKDSFFEFVTKGFCFCFSRMMIGGVVGNLLFEDFFNRARFATESLNRNTTLHGSTDGPESEFVFWYLGS